MALKDMMKDMASAAVSQAQGAVQAQKARAEEDLAGARSGKIDEELFVRFLKSGTTLTDEGLVDAFVYQAAVSTEDVIVTLNFDNEKGEPVRLDIERVLPEASWLPIASHNRTEVTVIAGSVFLRVSRFATFARTA